MEDLNLIQCGQISGADYGVCTIDEYWPDVVEVNYNYQSPMLIFSEAIGAAFVGCIGGFATGKGVPGCVISGGVAAGAKTLGYFIEDAYWMYQKASNK